MIFFRKFRFALPLVVGLAHCCNAFAADPPKEEEVPFACEVTYMVILYWLTHRERLLPDAVDARCLPPLLFRACERWQ